MNVYLTFDIEVWCNDWNRLDEKFPASFERYVYGRSPHGQYALPRTLEIMNQHGLVGVFFVEPLFSARFGAAHLTCITDLILDAGQDVQLHLHPEWTDEIRPPIIENCHRKRQHLPAYTADEQRALIAFGKRLVETSTGRPVTAFRAGSFAANRDTFGALAAQGIAIDSSLNAAFDHSAGTLEAFAPWHRIAEIDGISSHPVAVFRDGFGRVRPAQVGGCSFGEMRDALLRAQAAGQRHFVIVSHNFEMLRPGSSTPDPIVVSRFERLCAFLADHPDRFRVTTFGPDAAAEPAPLPQVSHWSTAVRYGEQAWRRLPALPR